MDRLFLVFQRWTTVTDRFQPNFIAHLDEYFEATDFRSRSANHPRYLSALTLHPGISR
jgi:hypothetical protein